MELTLIPLMDMDQVQAAPKTAQVMLEHTVAQWPQLGELIAVVEAEVVLTQAAKILQV